MCITEIHNYFTDSVHVKYSWLQRMILCESLWDQLSTTEYRNRELLSEVAVTQCLLSLPGQQKTDNLNRCELRHEVISMLQIQDQLFPQFSCG